MLNSPAQPTPAKPAAIPGKPKKREFMRRPDFLFVFRRRPIRSFPPLQAVPNWERDLEGWRTYIQSRLEKNSSYLSDAVLKERGVAPDSIIAKDIDTLNKHLVGPYIEQDYQAQYRQNQYFQFQWRFTVLALFSTVTASLIVMASADASLRIWVLILGILTTGFGAFTSLFANIYNRERPQRKWYEQRRIAEQLRKHYFLYLMHMAPYDTGSHVFVLKKVVDSIINLETKPFVPEPTTEQRIPQHTDTETQTLLNLYREFRVEAQENYYKKRGDEYDYNLDATLLMAWIIPLIVTLLSTINSVLGAIQNVPYAFISVIAVLTVILPSFAAAILSFQRIYDWERQLQLYGKTAAGLQSASIYDETITDKRKILVDMVTKTEQVLASEADQWGAPLSEPDKDITAEQILDSFLKRTGLAEDDPMAAQIRQHLNLKSGPTPPAIAPTTTDNAGEPQG
jgi:hypothetical protein